MNPGVSHLVVGPREHGVVRYAHAVADAAGEEVIAVDSVDDLLPRLPVDGRRAHVHYTDRLFGATATIAAAQFTSIAAAAVGPVGVTLHDVPQPSDGPAFATRAAAYRQVARAASGVVVSSDHERRLLVAFAEPQTDVGVVPLAVHLRVPRPVDLPPTRRDVAVLGFIYPGKGHAEALAAMESLGEEVGNDVGFLAIGRPSDGHGDLVDELRTTATRLGVRFDVTGFVGDAELVELAQSVAVPVAHHRHVSASGSVATWIGVGRRPLVPRNRYTEEIEARSPGALWIHDDTADGLRHAITEAVRDPERTWAAADVVPYPSLTQAAGLYTELFAQWSR